MKRIISFLLCLVLMTGVFAQTVFAAPAWPDNVSISAEGGILMDADSGAVLYGKSIHVPYFPASITKILTALIVIENCNLDDTVTFSHNAVYNVEADSSNANLEEGDTLTVRDCLYAMVLKSANEAANALAEHTAGSVEAFAAMMNAKASSLGCTDSHFNNPSGLNDPNHYTSAYDMALIAQAAFQNETFVAIDSTLYYDLPPTRRNPDGLRIYPGHRMLKKNMAQYYPGIIGGKTGYTSLAGNTLVTCAERNGMKLIAVVLNGHQTHYVDTKSLLDFGFANFRSVNVADVDTTYSSVTNDMTIAGLPTTDLSVLHMQEDCRITLPISADFTDAVSTISYDLSPSAPEHAIARIAYEYNGRQIGATYLIHNALGAAATEPAIEVSTEAPTEAASAASAGDAENGDNRAAMAAAGRSAGENADNSTGDGTDAGASGETAPEGLAAPGMPGNRSRNDTGSADSGKKSSGEKDKPGFHIPAPVKIALIVIAALALIGGGILLLKLHIEKREEAERMARYNRRKQRLQDIGMSSTEFDLLMQQKRSGPSIRQDKKTRRPKRHKSFLDSKR